MTFNQNPTKTFCLIDLHYPHQASLIAITVNSATNTPKCLTTNQPTTVTLINQPANQPYQAVWPTAWHHTTAGLSNTSQLSNSTMKKNVHQTPPTTNPLQTYTLAPTNPKNRLTPSPADNTITPNRFPTNSNWRTIEQLNNFATFQKIIHICYL